ncbi:MAG: HU family DNA-binding protein [Desulforhabdus sp.]|jgi:DNA-binding protein HU-beta|nr:HU family DNA-binding protein [Desulforhabdus sp.]
MTKAELVERIAKEAEITRKTASAALDSAMNIIKEAVKAGDPVTLIGFGTFKMAERAAREGRNPRTGKKMKIPAKNVVKFSAGKNFRESLNEKKRKKK